MKDNSGKIILALLAGASAGVITGLLMAPDKGLATRDNLKKTASKLGKDLEKRLQESMSKLEGLNAGSLIESATSMLGMAGKGGDAQGGSSAGANGSTGKAGGKGDSTSASTSGGNGGTSGGGASTTGGGAMGSTTGGDAGDASSTGGGATS